MISKMVNIMEMTIQYERNDEDNTIDMNPVAGIEDLPSIFFPYGEVEVYRTERGTSAIRNSLPCETRVFLGTNLGIKDKEEIEEEIDEEFDEEFDEQYDEEFGYEI
jgi:hypothetical protein